MGKAKLFLEQIIDDDSINNQRLIDSIWCGLPGWQQGQAAQGASQTSHKTIDTGYSPLNELLYKQGWPLGGTSEVGLSQPGIGEIRLLVPALRQLQRRSSSVRNIVFIAPPLMPMASSLLKEELLIDRITVVQPKTVLDTIWACEQALLSSHCAAVIAWTGRYNLSNKQSRRLQLAAEKSHSLHVLFRDSDCLKQASVSRLRLALQPTKNSELSIKLVKQVGHWGGQQCTVSLSPHYELWQRLPAALLPHHNRHYEHSIAQQVVLANSQDQQVASITTLPKAADNKRSR